MRTPKRLLKSLKPTSLCYAAPFSSSTLRTIVATPTSAFAAHLDVAAHGVPGAASRLGRRDRLPRFAPTVRVSRHYQALPWLSRLEGDIAGRRGRQRRDACSVSGRTARRFGDRCSARELVAVDGGAPNVSTERRRRGSLTRARTAWTCASRSAVCAICQYRARNGNSIDPRRTTSGGWGRDARLIEQRRRAHSQSGNSGAAATPRRSVDRHRKRHEPRGPR